LTKKVRLRTYFKAVCKLQGLDFLHSHGVIVMDIKPDNIFCNRSGTFQIGDFGVAVVSSLNWVCHAPLLATISTPNRVVTLKSVKSLLTSSAIAPALFNMVVVAW